MNLLTNRNNKFQKSRPSSRARRHSSMRRRFVDLLWTVAILGVLVIVGVKLYPHVLVWFGHMQTATE